MRGRGAAGPHPRNSYSQTSRSHHNPHTCLPTQVGWATSLLGSSWLGFLSGASGTSVSGAMTRGLVVWWSPILGFSHLDLSSQKRPKDDPPREDALRGMVTMPGFPGALQVGGRLDGCSPALRCRTRVFESFLSKVGSLNLA